MNVSDALGTHAAPWTIEHQGKVYRASVIDQAKKSAFERWLHAKIKSAFLDGEHSEQAVGVLADRIAEGRYAFHNALAQRMLASPEGAIVMMALVFGISQDEAIALTMAHKAEVNAILREVYAASFPRAAEPSAESTDPNPQGAASLVASPPAALP